MFAIFSFKWKLNTFVFSYENTFSSQNSRSIWPVAGFESSGLDQQRKSAIHGLPVTSGKSDWLRIRNKHSAHTQKIGSSQCSRSPLQARRIVGSGNENDENKFNHSSHKLSAIVPRTINKSLISGRFLRLCSSSLFKFDEHFMTLFSVRYF